MENHTNFKRVVGLEMGLLAPMVVEERFAVKANELANQAPKCVVGRGLDLEIGASRKLRQLEHTQSQFAYDTEAAASAAFQRPKQVRIHTRIGDAYFAIGGDNLRFE